MLATLTTLTGAQNLYPGGHNWPDMWIVVDPDQTDIEDHGIYLVQVKDREPVVKRCVRRGESELFLHPALSTVHGQETINLLGRKIPCQTIEFSDNFYLRYVKVHGRIVGLWAGRGAI